MNILSALKNEASKLQQQLDTINAAMKILGGKNRVGNGRKKHRRGRKMSAATKAKISKAAKARWAAKGK